MARKISKIPKGKIKPFLKSQKEKLEIQKKERELKQYNSTERIENLKKQISLSSTKDPEDLMIIIIDNLKETEFIPEVNGFYTFIYNAKTPNIEYDQHPLIVCLEILPWGFRGFNFHWRKYRNYTWMEVVGQMHIVHANELDELLAIPYAKFRLNK